MKGLFIPEITAEMFRNGCFESIEALMAEDTIYDIDYPLEQEPCEDYISRVEARKHIYDMLVKCAISNEGYKTEADKVYMDIADNRLDIWFEELPSVQPARKKGKWKELGYTIPDVQSNKEWECNQCHRSYRWFEPTPNYCPNCGAEMEVKK